MTAKYIWFFVLIVLIAAFLVDQSYFFHFHRIVVPESIYIEKVCDCLCILEARPWYVKINYWLWLFFLIIPLLVFSTPPQLSVWKRGCIAFITMFLGYGLVLLNVDSGFIIRNGPFVVYDDVPFQKTMDMIHCYGGSRMASRVFALVFGWLYPAVYIGWWQLLWTLYHRRKTRLVDASFKYDWFSCVLMVLSIMAPILILIWFL